MYDYAQTIYLVVVPAAPPVAACPAASAVSPASAGAAAPAGSSETPAPAGAAASAGATQTPAPAKAVMLGFFIGIAAPPQTCHRPAGVYCVRKRQRMCQTRKWSL